MTYDSRVETYQHILRVNQLLNEFVKELHWRGLNHDYSKTMEPELSMYDEFTPKLKDSTYGSEEYKGFLKAMGPGLLHHYSHNRHHPEFHPDGVDGMNLADMMEMLADWKAATERHADGDLARSLQIQKERFGISEQLYNVLWNTAMSFGWVKETKDGS